MERRKEEKTRGGEREEKKEGKIGRGRGGGKGGGGKGGGGREKRKEMGERRRGEIEEKGGKEGKEKRGRESGRGEERQRVKKERTLYLQIYYGHGVGQCSGRSAKVIEGEIQCLQLALVQRIIR